MKSFSKILSVVVAIVCIAILVYLFFFFNGSKNLENEVTTIQKQHYSITFDNDVLEYNATTNFINGVTAIDENGNDLLKYVTVSCKPTDDIKVKTLTYSINKAGYEIQSFERTLVIKEKYNGPSIEHSGDSFKIPIDRVGNISSEIAKSDIVDTDDGFGGKCSISAVINADKVDVGDYVATVTAQNLLGDTASVKIAVTVTESEASIIKLKASSVSVGRGEAFEPLDYVVSAYDETYGDVTANVVVDNTVDTSVAGVYTVEYRIGGIKELENEKTKLYVTVN